MIVLETSLRGYDAAVYTQVRALVFVTSLAVNLPINGDQADWSVQAPPADWASVRDRWQLAHAIRTISAVLAFCSLTVAAITRTASRRTGVGAGRVPIDS